MQSSRQQNCTWSLRADSPIDKQADSPLGLISEVLVGLYGHVEGHYSGTGAQSEEERVREQALAASCPVCRQWCKIVMSIWGGGLLLGYNETSLRSLLPYCTLRSTQSKSESNGITPRSGWFHVHSPQFPSELLPNIIPNICGYVDEEGERNLEATKITLAACCLVSREWNRIFTPILYEDITLPSEEPRHLISQSLLLRTFRHTQPGHKYLVREMSIELAKDGSIADVLSICFSMPQLRKLTLEFEKINPSTLHPNFAQQLRSLSKRCLIHVYQGSLSVNWLTLRSSVDFVRRSNLTIREFRINSRSCK